MRLLDTVRLKRPVPEHELHRGQRGVIVEVLAEDVFEVEFIDDQGTTLAILPLPEDALALETVFNV